MERGKAGGYPADVKMIYSTAGDLFNQLPNVNKIVAAAERLEFMVVHDHFLTHRALRRHRATGHHLLGAQRRAHAVGGCRPLRDLHAEGDRADGRVPQRHRHLHRPGSARWASRATTTRPRTPGCASSPRDAIDDFDTFRTRAWPGCRRPRTRWPSPGRSATPSGTRSPRRRARSRSTRCRWRPSPIPTARGDPAHPDLDPRPPAPRPSAPLISPKSRARTHSIHANQPVLAGATATTYGSIPATPPPAASPTVTACASSTIAGPRYCRPG